MSIKEADGLASLGERVNDVPPYFYAAVEYIGRRF